MKTDIPRWNLRELLLGNLALVAIFIAEHIVGNTLPLPRGHALPLFAPMGVGLALCVVAGWRVLPGFLLGLLFFNLPMIWMPHLPASQVWVASIIVPLGATLQCWLGTCAFRRWISPALASVRDVVRFLILAPAMCVVSPSIALPTMQAAGLTADAGPVEEWINWWAGDTLGVLLGAPLTWIVIGLPRPLWRRRVRMVALPLLLAGAAVLATYTLTARWEAQRHLVNLRVRTQEAADLVQAGFSEYVRFTEVVARAMRDRDGILSAEVFARVAGAYAEGHPELHRFSWLVRVSGSERPLFEAWARANVDPGFSISDFGPGGQLQPAPARALYYTLLYAAPASAPRPLGLDYLGEPYRADALHRSMRQGRAAASVPLQLYTLKRPGILLARAIGTVPGAPAAVLLLTIDADRVVRYALAQTGIAGVDYELVDITAPGAGTLAAGQVFGASRLGETRLELRLADRRYRLAFAPRASYAAQFYGWASWTVLTSGMLLVSLLGALLLLTTGERARIETQVVERTARLRNREARLQAILEHAADAIVTVDAHGIVLSANRATERLFGHGAASLAGRSLAELAPLGRPDPRQALECLAIAPEDERELQGTKADGATVPLSISVAPLRLEDEQLYVCILHDLTEQRRSQADNYRLAHYDALTGLENRYALGVRLEAHLAQARRSGEAVAVLFIDLDRFKLINDSYGHAAGDQLLVGAAQRMKELLRRDIDTLGRLGGDEFVIVLGGPLTPDSVTTVAVRVVDSLAQSYQLAGTSVHSGSSVGVALYPGDGTDAATLLRNADTAMYAAKRAGRGNFQFFSEEMNVATHEHLLLETRMRIALAEDGFDLHVQPQIELDTGRVIGAEMLLRWNDSELGQVEPSRIIAVAEECGLILPLGDWVLARAMQLLADWQQHDGMSQLRLAVNLSAHQFSSSALLARLDLLLAEHRINPACLELEITETAAMSDPEKTRRLLDQLHERGIKLAIDDFGTGYSSLAYLKLFPIDLIKIDQGFVKDIESDPNDAAIVAATIGLAHSLGLGVVAEGVETQAQWGFLRDKLSDEAQGFLFARPMPAAQFRDFVRERAQPVPGP
jgi:diguanylate cyclase (GGDEF)-like protein/PAS domain S-box-containing protein